MGKLLKCRMKVIYLLIFCYSILFLGCSSTTWIGKYSYNKSEAYKNFNRFAKNKDLEVTLYNDSSFTLYNGVIKNDTLCNLNNITLSGNNSIALSKIKKVVYKNHWLGIPIYMVVGAASGFFIGSIANSNNGNGTSRNPELTPTLGGLIYAVFGSVVGAVAGWFLSYNYVYVFN